MSKKALRDWLSKRDLAAVAAAFFGLIFGTWYLGPKNILPGTTDWLNRGDLAAFQIGWEFFRQTPLVQWPLTAVPNYGVSFHTVLISGNALIEVPLKYLGPILPPTFQYLGMWIVGCFALQGYFAARLLSHFVSDRFIRFAIAAIFVISPALLVRMGVGHPLLGAHWLILWAFYLYFGNRQSHARWSILIAIAIAINIYLSVMVICIYLAALFKVLLTGREARRDFGIGRLVLVPTVVGALTFIVMGYLEYGSSAKGTGFFRLNVAAFVNPRFSPQDSFSYILDRFGPSSTRPFSAYEGEGFQYLGLGAILTIPLLVLYLIRHGVATWWRTTIPLLSVCVLLFLVAVSNRVVIVRHEFTYPLPQSILDLRQVFRAATRFAWPMYYLLTLAGVVAMVRLVRGRVAIIVVTLLILGVHILDQGHGLTYFHRELSSQPPYRSPLVDPEWSSLAKSYRKINLFPNFDLQVDEDVPDAEFWDEQWYHFAKFAADNKLTTGFGYLPRPVIQYVEIDNRKMTDELESGELEANAIYVLSNRETWMAARDHLIDSSRALVLDGYYVVLGPIIPK